MDDSQRIHLQRSDMWRYKHQVKCSASSKEQDVEDAGVTTPKPPHAKHANSPKACKRQRGRLFLASRFPPLFTQTAPVKCERASQRCSVSFDTRKV
ncbi:hypothetical protein ABVT39_011793 [Epinephelus coioides]